MTIHHINNILKQGEGIRVEFKKAQNDLPENLFETICAMLNRTGGDIILGVDDQKNLIGIHPEKVDKLVARIVNHSNNPEKLNPPFILFPKALVIDGLAIIHIQVFESSQVHQTARKIYDRSNDGDFWVKDPQQIAELYNKKRNHYSEGIIYPAFRFDDFNLSLFPKVRNLIRSYNADHPWLKLNNEQMLKMAGLWDRDYKTGEEGFTLAAVLLFGKDEVIQRIVPHYKIDALLRQENITRYDDRLYIQTNLIEAYEQLLDFVAKHLPDKFYLEGDQRRSLRTIIFRELAANVIVHREYTNAFPTTFVITKTAVITENANIANGLGPISVDNFKPFPKNPTIAKFFMQLGRFEELGSGILNVNRFLKAYSGRDNPQFIEGPTFKTIIPLNDGFEEDNASVKTSDRINDRISDRINDRINDRIKSGVIKSQSKIVVIKIVRLSQLIYRSPLLNAKELASKINISVPTVSRYLKILKLIGVSELKGAKKTGGYQIISLFQSEIETINGN